MAINFKVLEDRKPTGCKWVFKLRFKVDGFIECYKTRLVVKGYSQIISLDYQKKVIGGKNHFYLNFAHNCGTNFF